MTEELEYKPPSPFLSSMLTKPHTGSYLIRYGEGEKRIFQMGKGKNIYQLSTLGLNYIML